MTYFKSLLLLSIFLLVSGCMKTRDPNFIPIELNHTPYPPWDAPVFTYTEMLSYFSGTDYSGLTSIHVAVTGNDANGDGSQANPYRTIQYAIDQHGTAGVIIRVHAGTYKEHLSTLVRATQAQPFVLLSEDGQYAAVIDGENKSEDIVRLNGQHNIIDGFEVKNTKEYGVAIFSYDSDAQPDATNSYNIVRNCKVHHAGRDIIKSAHINFVLIENNDISFCLNEVQADNAIDGVAVYHTISRNNYIHDISPGIGGYYKGGSHNNIWYNNIFKDIGDPTDSEQGTGTGLQLGGGGQFSWRDDMWYEYPAGHEQLAFNNVFINCAKGGVVFTSCWKAKVYNNSFYNCGYISGPQDAKSIMKVYEPNNLPSQDIEIFNNVYFNDASKTVDYFYFDHDNKYTTGYVTHGYNSVFNGGQSLNWNFPNGTASTDVLEDVLFIDPTNDNLQLQPGSPAIDAGLTTEHVTFDFNMVFRPQGAAFDRGAYEQ